MYKKLKKEICVCEKYFFCELYSTCGLYELCTHVLHLYMYVQNFSPHSRRMIHISDC